MGSSGPFDTAGDAGLLRAPAACAAFGAVFVAAEGTAAEPFEGLGTDGSPVAFAGAGLGFSSTLRTRSAMLSGTTLSWFFASKTPPSRSLKRVISSFEVSPTSFASSNIRTFPVAKFCLSL
jgi:hypothetical protein